MTLLKMSNYLDLMKLCLLDAIYGSQHMGGNGQIGGVAAPHEIENGTYWPARAHTMIGLKRLQNIQQCIEDVIQNNIPGDLIETGVWRGGATIFMKAVLTHHNDSRKVFVADSFEGLPPPDPSLYPADRGDNHHTIPCLAVDLNTVRNNFAKYNLLDNNVVFVKGFFEHSLKRAPITTLSVLRLDGDMYSSTIQVLDILYDKVSVGGYIIVDDYALPGCKQAIHDFRHKHNITDEIMHIDATSCYWKKS